MNETFFQPSFSCVYVQFSLSTRSDMIFHPDQTPDIGTPSGASQQARVLGSGLSFCFFRASHVWLRTHVLYSRLHQPQKKHVQTSITIASRRTLYSSFFSSLFGLYYRTTAIKQLLQSSSLIHSCSLYAHQERQHTKNLLDSRAAESKQNDDKKW